MSEIPTYPNEVPELNTPKPSKEEFIIKRLRKQLKRTQGQVQRLTTEAGTRFLKSQAAMFFSMLVAERAAHEKTKRQLSDSHRELQDAKRKNGEVTMDALRRLVEQAEAASKTKR